MRPLSTDDPGLPETFPGQRYCKAMQAAVDAILLPMGIRRRVVSRGTSFVNHDAWTDRAFADQVCEQFSNFPKRLPSAAELTAMLDKANQFRCADPYIQVARMPEHVTQSVALAIVGGGYHEAWHTKYSKRSPVKKVEAEAVLKEAEPVIAGGGSFDAKMRGLLLTMHHLIEDIRIERRGNEDFPGTYKAMCDLQDFILNLEEKSRIKGAKVKNIDVSMNSRSILLCCFRDLGLGYDTTRARQAIEFYKKSAPEAIAFLAPGGLLEPLLEEAQELPSDDPMGSLRVAMKFVAVLWKATQNENPQEEPTCPQCGAGIKNLVLRGVRDEQGNRVPGKAEVECKICGFKTIVDLPDNSLNLDQGDEDSDKPEIEDLEHNDADGFGDDEREHRRDQRKRQKPKDSKKSKPDFTDEEEPSDATPEDESSDSSPEEPKEEDGGEEEGADALEGIDLRSLIQFDENGDLKLPLATEDGDDEVSLEGSPLLEILAALGAGGHQDLGRDPKNTLRDAYAILEGEDKDGALNNMSAFGSTFMQVYQELAADKKRGEQLWQPYSTERDEARLVRSDNQALDLDLANHMLQSVRAETAYLRARFRALFRAQEMTDIAHGVPKGPRLSDRMLVDSLIDLREGKVPQRPCVVQDIQTDTSFAWALCLDQSGSMSSIRVEVAKCVMAVIDPVSKVGGASFVFGFRNGEYISGAGFEDRQHHRMHGVRYDIFKAWEENFEAIKWRFANTHATGGTPMADGVQYGLAALADRSETHRILAVVTDGMPDTGHGPVMNRQIRLAKEAGIHVLGVGVGQEAIHVKTTFPDHVWAAKTRDLPPALMKKLTEICLVGPRTKNRQVKLDGKVSRRIT